MKKTIGPLFLSAVLLVPALPSTQSVPIATAATIPGAVTQIDIVTKQGGGVAHPDQVAIERTLQPGNLQVERLRMTPVAAKRPFGMAAVAGSKNVYITDRDTGSLWEIEPDSGKVIRKITPSQKPSNAIHGIATGLGEDIYVYYNNNGTIQRLKKDGTVAESFMAPTLYGHSLSYKDGFLYLLDDRGTVYQMDTYSKKVVNKIRLKKPDGNFFDGNMTFTLFWDGKYWNICNAQDGWKIYRYDTAWNFNSTVNLQNWSMMGIVYNGQEYLVMNNDNNRIFTIRYVDDVSGEVDQKQSPHYQYLGNLLTTDKAHTKYPNYEDKNVALIFNDPRSVTNTTLKPYVAYLDRSGKRVDTMFDAFVFLPAQQTANKIFEKITDPAAWNAYLDKTVKDIGILDQEWAARNKDLGKKDKAKVYIATPYPNPSVDLATNKQALHKYMDDAAAKINANKYSNIQFQGYYWFHEDAQYGEEIIVDFNKYADQKGLLTMWIPYHSSTVSDHSVLGFDEVFHQPNYYFKGQGYVDNINRFYNLAWTGVRYNKGVEIELDEQLFTKDPDYKKRLKDYLTYGLELGYLNAPKAWYDNYAIPSLYFNKDELYDVIHQAIKGTYTDPNVQIHTAKDGILAASEKVSVPSTAKIRLNLLTDKPYAVQKIILHTDNSAAEPLNWQGELRVDEELAVKNGQLVKQEIGKSADGLRLGFNVPLKTPVQVSIVPTGKTPFGDIKAGDSASQAILALSSSGVINGMQNREGKWIFDPAGKITRAQFAVMLTNAYQLTAKNAVKFSDSKGAWYSDYIAAVTENGYMSGYDLTTFGPNDPITQEQVAVILVRILHQKGIQTSIGNETIVNLGAVSTWAKDNVLEGKKLGLYTDTFGATGFSPQTPATRSDVAQVLYKALGLKK